MEKRMTKRTGAAGGGGKTVAVTECGVGAKQSAVAVGSEEPDVTTYAANCLNQYICVSNFAGFASWRETIPTYDWNGNMTWDGTNAYFWDLQNQLILVSNFQYQVSNFYDAMGRRVWKEVCAYNSSTGNYEPVTTNVFYYDGWNLVRETVAIGNQQSAITNCYVWGTDLSGSLQGAGGVGGLLAVTCVSSNTSYLLPLTYYPLYDHNGNVERYVARNGATVASFQYDAFGATTAQSGDMADSFTHRFSTKPFDAETGLVMYQLRPYEPGLGRWITRDPIEEQGGVGLYGFVGNDPVNQVDLLGGSTFATFDMVVIHEIWAYVYRMYYQCVCDANNCGWDFRDRRLAQIIAPHMRAKDRYRVTISKDSSWGNGWSMFSFWMSKWGSAIGGVLVELIVPAGWDLELLDKGAFEVVSPLEKNIELPDCNCDNKGDVRYRNAPILEWKFNMDVYYENHKF